MALNACCQNHRKNVTLHQKYRWYHFSAAAVEVCVYYLLCLWCLDSIHEPNTEAVFTLKNKTIFFSLSTGLGIALLFTTSLNTTLFFTSHEIWYNHSVIVRLSVGEFTLSVIAANWKPHTKLVVIRARFALFHLAALHYGESGAFAPPPMGALWSPQAAGVTETLYHTHTLVFRSLFESSWINWS